MKLKKKNPYKNILLIVADTLRADYVGLYTKKPTLTPSLDSLGRDGVVFKNAYATITCTDPSITAIMSGRYPLSTGLVNHGWYVSSEEEKNVEGVSFLAELLQKNGYKTAAVDWVGRWHKQGYDYYSGKLKKWGNTQYPIISYLPFPFAFRAIDKLTGRFLKKEFLLPLYYSLFPHPVIPYDTADMIVDKAQTILEENKKNNLFLYLHFWDPHMPHTQSRGLKSYLFDSVETIYGNEVSFMDREIGRLIQYLKKTNQYEDTLIIVTADHGESFYDHDVPFNHENLYQDVVNVPLTFSHPQLPKKQISSLVQHVDILPTILDILHISIPDEIEGKSLTPLINGKKKQIRESVYFEDITYNKLTFIKNVVRRRGVFDGKYKYIETLSGSRKEMYRVVPKTDSQVTERKLLNLSSGSEINISGKSTKKMHVLKNILHDTVYTLQNNFLSHNPELRKKIQKSNDILQNAFKQFDFKEIVVAWKGGKDTTVALHLIYQMFQGKIPVRIFFNDTTMEFDETYHYIKKMQKLWNLKMVVIKHDQEDLKEFNQDNKLTSEKAHQLKIKAIEKAVKQYKFKAFIVGIRWDEQRARSDETYFSKRKDHTRIHPILHFTEKDIWNYYKIFGIPYSKLYDKGYRSVGEKHFTKKVSSGNERAGRDPEKEKIMGRLRKMGYW